MITRKSDVENSFWNLSIEEACHTFAVGPKGLEDSEVARRLKQKWSQYFKNNTNTSIFILFISQFKSPITILLIVAAILSAGLGDISDNLIILCIITVSSLPGFWQEKGAVNTVNEHQK